MGPSASRAVAGAAGCALEGFGLRGDPVRTETTSRDSRARVSRVVTADTDLELLETHASFYLGDGAKSPVSPPFLSAARTELPPSAAGRSSAQTSSLRFLKNATMFLIQSRRKEASGG